MSVFSDLLSEYITMKDVGVYPLSQFCGLDRSFMYKIINGKRNPSGEDVVRKMAQFMQLTPRDRANLRMIRETKERAEHALNISVNANEGYLLFQTRTERLIYLSIREPSILMAFYDYLESMKPEELCTEEEMLGRVEAILYEFVACHSREGSI